MISKVLDLLIAVTLVYAIESIYSMIRGGECHKLQLFLICSINWKEVWLYILPPIAMIFHIAQVAHYHQKRGDWKVEEFIDKEIEGRWELLQIFLYIIPVGALILATRLLPYGEYRTGITICWFITFLAYTFGDLLTIFTWNDEENKHPNFSRLLKVAWIFDLVMFILGISITCYFYYMNCENRKESWLDGVSIFSSCIFCYTIILYRYGRGFLLSTPQNNNSNWQSKLSHID